MRLKQCQTAKRVHECILAEFSESYDCSYPLVQRCIKARKAERAGAQGALELVWAPGEAQAEFGEPGSVQDSPVTGGRVAPN